MKKLRRANRIAAQLHPRPWTIYTAAALVGTAASPLWAAQGLLITHLAVGFAEARRSPDATSATGTFNVSLPSTVLYQEISTKQNSKIWK